MNEFVNYGHRGISLPEGCKDLADLLRKESEQAPKMVRRTTEGLRQLDGYLSELLSSPGGQGVLSILAFDFNSGVFLQNSKGVLSATVAMKAAGSTEERAVRECFRLAGVAPLTDDLPAGSGGARLLRYPLPASIPDLERLISEVLRAACGATEHAGLYYGYFANAVA